MWRANKSVSDDTIKAKTCTCFRAWSLTTTPYVHISLKFGDNPKQIQPTNQLNFSFIQATAEVGFIRKLMENGHFLVLLHTGLTPNVALMNMLFFRVFHRLFYGFNKIKTPIKLHKQPEVQLLPAIRFLKPGKQQPSQ
jgi:hypothetical protein